MDRTTSGMGFLNIALEDGDAFTVAGNLETVVNKASLSTLTIGTGSLSTLTIDEQAFGSRLVVDDDAAVQTLNLDTATPVTGGGDIDKLNVLTAGSSTTMLPDNVDIRPGLTANIAGTSMNPAKARESSSTPRILAGFPKVTNIAPTTATATFSTNKTGTLYWAVSPISAGSVQEKTLLDPRNVNSIVSSGNIKINEAEKNFTANINRMTAATPYYLTAMLVDARGVHSAIKVVSFTTTDTSNPNFASGYPKVTQNSFERRDPTNDYFVQITSVSTKDSDLYWAIYEDGATAPATSNFIAGNLPGALAFGKDRADRNLPVSFNVHDLDETTKYVAYLWLNDSDNARSSAVRNVRFTTVDGTPPIFNYVPFISARTATSLRMLVNVNEQSTVYWAVVDEGTDYLKADESPEYHVRKIENGITCLKHGSVSVRPDVDGTINITGLSPASHYDIYFVAKDRTGNYSEPTTKVPMRYISANTLDTVPPTVQQVFTHCDSGDATKPYADTDIHLVFSEDIARFSTDGPSFLTLYQNVLDAKTDEAKDAAREILAEALRNTIKLYNTANRNNPVQERNKQNAASIANWVVDYRNVVVTKDDTTKTVTLNFKSGSALSDKDAAITLASGSSYYFVLDDICDVSDSRNRMGRTTLPEFTTISAQVSLNAINVTSIPGSDGSTIPIDMAFSMTPISTNVDNDVDWDMLFWSDTSVSFQVYELQPASAGAYTGTVINGGKVVPIVNNTGSGYIGRSLFRDFYGLDHNPSVTGEGNRINNALPKDNAENAPGIMVSNQPKYYGIHFTEVKDQAEKEGSRDLRPTWDATVNYRISIVCGSSPNLENLAKNITEETLEYYMQNWGISEIHTPNPFDIQKRFSNSDAPNFYDGYPQLPALADSTATLRVMLDRAGTLYYAVGPIVVNASENKYSAPIGTSATSTSISGLYDPEIVAASGGQPTIPTIESGLSGVEVDMPRPATIYSPRFGNTDIKSGKVEL
ncbi:MAG: hypothetical protein IJ705_00635, partial [Oscillospiraceae bacterium]|nr:hypothetical protein [Oscillospiraceae bacterium]